MALITCSVCGFVFDVGPRGDAAVSTFQIDGWQMRCTDRANSALCRAMRATVLAALRLSVAGPKPH